MLTKGEATNKMLKSQPRIVVGRRDDCSKGNEAEEAEEEEEEEKGAGKDEDEDEDDQEADKVVPKEAKDKRSRQGAKQRRRRRERGGGLVSDPDVRDLAEMLLRTELLRRHVSACTRMQMYGLQQLEPDRYLHTDWAAPPICRRTTAPAEVQEAGSIMRFE